VGRIILLVEDNADDELLMRRALQQSGVAVPVVTVHDGQEAKDYFTRSGRFTDRDLEEVPALVLLDLQLPRVSGVEVLAFIRQREETRELPVVALTISRNPLDIERCYQLGINSYIYKPAFYDDFVAAVRQLGLYWLLLNVPPGGHGRG
jgi:two-component system response regulator